MKRLMPASLISFLQNAANRNCLRADLISIVLPTGAVMNVTSGQWDITLTTYNASTGLGTPGWNNPNTTFYALQFGKWTRGPITSEASFSLTSNTMSLALVAAAGLVYPNMSIGMLNAVLNGLFDAATVSVYTAYMPVGGYGNVSAGIETKFLGDITKVVKVDRIHAEFECQDALYRCNMKVPTRLFQSNCMWGFCDSNCTLNPATYTQAFVAFTGSTQNLLIPASAFTQAAGWATQGVVTCTAGANKGLSVSVKLHDGSGHLVLMNPFLLPVTAGDTFSVIAGCDKQFSSCKTRKTAANASVDNSINFGGFPFIPPPTSVL
jgi:uncharacterized phage protein (TIGR02218 family)